MDIRVVTSVLWTLFFGLLVAGFMFERHLKYLMKTPTDIKAEVRSHRKTIRGVDLSWQDDVPPSPWDTFSWEEKMSWIRRRSILSWVTALAGLGVIISWLFYAMHEMELMAQAGAGDIPQAAIMLLNRPEVIYQAIVLVATIVAIAWTLKNPP